MKPVEPLCHHFVEILKGRKLQREQPARSLVVRDKGDKKAMCGVHYERESKL